MENNSMTLLFNVEHQTLTRTSADIVVENSLNYLYAQFTFSSDWDNTTKYIIVEGNDLRFKVLVDEDNTCKIPNEIIKFDGFKIMLVGENERRYVVITTTTLKIQVFKANYENAEEPDVRFVRSNTLDIDKDGDLVDIEIPNIYFTDANLTNDILEFLGRDNVLLRSIGMPYGKIHNITIAIDNTTYQFTLNAYDKDNNLLFTRTADFDIEGMLIESASYDSARQELVLTFKNGDVVRIPISDILTGIATEDWVNTNFYNKSYIDTNKQDTLVNQTNIKSINGTSILGSGNIDTQNVGFIELDFSVAVDNEISITDEQLALMQKDYAVVKVENDYFDKKYINTDDNEIVFFNMMYFQTILNSGIRENVMNYIVVNTSEKTATYTTDTIFSFYEKGKTDELLATKQNVIDSSHKLDADLVDDTNATHKFATSGQLNQIATNQSNITALQNSKQDVLSGSDSIDITSNVVSVKDSYVEGFFATDLEVQSMLSEVFE